MMPATFELHRSLVCESRERWYAVWHDTVANRHLIFCRPFFFVERTLPRLATKFDILPSLFVEPTLFPKKISSTKVKPSWFPKFP